MIALLLAAQVTAHVMAGPPPRGAIVENTFAARTAYQRAACKGEGTVQTSGPDPALLYRPKDKARTVVSKLADLPKANLEVAVNRIGPDGCPNPVVLQVNVGP